MMLGKIREIVAYAVGVPNTRIWIQLHGEGDTTMVVSERHESLLAQVSDIARTEDELVQLYAAGILSDHAGINWLDINAAIIARSSNTNLQRIKTKAWKIVEKHKADAKRPFFSDEEVEKLLNDLLFPAYSIDKIPSRWLILARLVRDAVEDKLLGKRGV